MLSLWKILYLERERETCGRTDRQTDRHTHTHNTHTHTHTHTPHTHTHNTHTHHTHTHAHTHTHTQMQFRLSFSNSYIYHRHHQKERTECAARDTTSNSVVHLQHGRKGRCSTFTRHQENGHAATVRRHDFLDALWPCSVLHCWITLVTVSIRYLYCCPALVQIVLSQLRSLGF